MSRLQKNLNFLIGNTKTNPNRLVAEINAKLKAGQKPITQPTLFRILTGETADPRSSTLEPIAQFFGLTVEQLRNLDLTRPVITASHITPAERHELQDLPQHAITLSAASHANWSLDYERLQLVLDVFFKWLEQNKGRVKIDQDRYAKVITLLYRYANEKPQASVSELQELLKLAA